MKGFQMGNGYSVASATTNTTRLTQRHLLAAAALALCVIVATAVWGLAVSGAWAVADDGSATTTAEIVLVVAGDEPANPVTSAPGYTRGSSPNTGDPLTWAPFALLAAAALAVGAFAYRRSGAVRSVTPAHSAGPSAPAKRHVRSSAAMHAVPTPRTQVNNAPKPRVREFDMPAHRRIFSAILVVVLVAGLAPTVPVQQAQAAEGAEDSSQIRIELADAGDGTLSGTATYNVPNDATYYRELVKLAEESAAGYNLADGSITITVAPASDPADAIASPDAVKGAATSGGNTWLVPGSAVTDDASLALKITATATGLKAGEHKVGTVTAELEAVEYEGMAVRLSTSPVVGRPLKADVSAAPAEAQNDFTFTWLASDDGVTWQPIEGATAAAFTPSPDLAGKRISVKVECSNPAYYVVDTADFGLVAQTCLAPAAGQHVVIFDVGEAGNPPAAQLVDDGDFAARPDLAQAGSYNLAGWYADENLTEPFSFATTPITQDTLLYAKWGTEAPVGTYAVVHRLQQLDDPTAYDEAATDVREGEYTGDIASIARAYTGFTAKSPAVRDESHADELVLNLYYDRNSYTVTFHANGAVHDTATALYQAAVEAPATAPTAPGKTFKHWTTAQDGNGAAYDFATPVTGDLDLYAAYDTQMLEVTFETWGQESVASQSVAYGATAARPDSPVAGQGDPKFVRWCADAAQTEEFDFNAPITQNTTVYAEYEPSVCFDLDGKADTVSVPVAYNGSIAVNVASDYLTTVASGSTTRDISVEGYRITGWYETSDRTGTAVTQLTDITGNKTLYAAITPIAYSVSFDANTGSGTMDAQQFSYDEQKALATCAFTKTGYDFAGWNTAADGSGTAYADGQEVKNLSSTQGATVQLHAQWQPSTNTAYTVKHLWQNIDNDLYTEHESETLHGTTGGQTAATAKEYSGLTAQAFDQKTIAADGTTVVEIRYNRGNHTVTFDANGHGTAPAAETGLRFGGKVTAPAAPDAEGYTFGGWFKEPGCTNEWNFASDVIAGDTTLYAKWTGKTYSITFAANADPEGVGDTTTASVTDARVGSPATLTANGFARQGWTFAGWNTSADGKGTAYADGATRGDFSTTGENVTLYAQWTGNAGISYTVNHYKRNAANNDYESTPAATDTPLTGIAGAQTAAVAKDYSADGFTAKAIEQQTINGTGSTVVNVYYDWNTYTVTYETWGQAVAKQKDEDVRHGTTVEAPASPVKDAGSPKFVGWFTDAALETEFNFSTPITADITLYAKYTPNVLVDFQGAAPNASVGAEYNQEFAASKLDDVKAPGYRIDGYYYDPACADQPVTFPITPTEDVHLYAKLTPLNVNYTVNHRQQSLADSTAYELVETETLSGLTATETAAAAKGYAGFTAKDFAQATIKSDGSTVIDIYYDRKADTPYKVEHYQQNVAGDDYVLVDTDNLKGVTGAATAATAKTYTGFSAAKPFSQQAIAGDESTTVKLYYDRLTYTVGFDNGEHGTAPDTQTVAYQGTAGNPGDLSEYGWVFGGWRANSASGAAYDFATPVTASTTLYANWEKDAYTVTFSLVDKITGTVAEQRVAYQEAVTKPADPATAAGYHFDNWYRDSAHQSVFDFATAKITEAITIYGNAAANSYTIAFGANGGTGTTASVSATFDEDATLTANGFSKAGYTFAGWATEEGGSKAYDDKDTVKNLTDVQNGSVTLYAVWAPITYTISFNAGSHGTVSPESVEKTYDTALASLPTPERAGYTFDAWYTGESGTGTKLTASTDVSTEADATVTVYANWTPNANTPYTVKHWKQKLNDAGDAAKGTEHNDENYELVSGDTQELTGATDTNTVAEAKSYTGFTAQSFDQVNIDPTGDAVVNVYYNRDTYTITYASNGGNDDVPAAQTKVYGATVSLATATPTRNGGTETRTVTFDASGGSSTGATDDKMESTATATYEFSKWNTAQTGDGTEYEAGVAYSANASATLYAQWTAAEVVTPITLPTPTREGYYFAGWLNGDENVGPAGVSYTPTANVTLKADWATSVIVYHNYGSASGMSERVGDNDTKKEVVQGALYSTGYKAYTQAEARFEAPAEGMAIAAWNTKPDGSGRWVLPGEAIAANDNTMQFSDAKLDLYAQWSYLGGKTATEVKAMPYDEKYLGDIWVSDKFDVVPSNATKEVDQVMICRLIGPEPGTTTKAFMAVRVLPVAYQFDPNAQNSLPWTSNAMYSKMQSEGSVYAMMPSSLKSAVSSASKVSVDSSKNSSSAVAVFWLISVSELYNDSSLGDEGPQYAYFSQKGVTSTSAAALAGSCVTNAGEKLSTSESGGVPEAGYSYLRSVHIWSNAWFRAIIYGVSGVEDGLSGSYSSGISPCFCL